MQKALRGVAVTSAAYIPLWIQVVSKDSFHCVYFCKTNSSSGEKKKAR